MSTLRRNVRFHLVPPPEAGASDVPVKVALVYDPADPYAIRARFATGANKEAVWDFSRELVGRGLIERTGVGDVAVAPMPDRPGHVQFVLSSPSGRAVFAVEAACLQAFLTRTYARVPAGTEMEHVDLDAELAVLFGTEVEHVDDVDLDAELAALLEDGFPDSGGSAR